MNYRSVAPPVGVDVHKLVIVYDTGTPINHHRGSRKIAGAGQTGTATVSYRVDSCRETTGDHRAVASGLEIPIAPATPVVVMTAVGIPRPAIKSGGNKADLKRSESSDRTIIHKIASDETGITDNRSRGGDPVDSVVRTRCEQRNDREAGEKPEDLFHNVR